MKSINSILLIEDNHGDARLLQEMFKERETVHCTLSHVGSIIEAERHVAEHPVDLILLDLGLPDADALGAICRIRAAAPSTPLVVLTGLDDDEIAVQALHEGAQDFLVKGQIDARGLLRALRYAIERKHLESRKDEFVSSVSHELRTPLTSICASLALLTGNAAGKLPDPAERLIAIAHTNCQRLVRLVNDILDVEKLESGQARFSFEKIAVASLVAQAIESNQGFAEEHGVRMRIGHLPAVADVWADPDRLVQVITNLLSNAIKFTVRGTEVEVAIESADGDVRIVVRDHGPGIVADFKPRIFERFAQSDASDARLRGGTGLGLSIVKQIVDRLGGKVGFDDAPGGGTIFYVDLPRWKADDDVMADPETHLEALNKNHRELDGDEAATPVPTPAASKRD